MAKGDLITGCGIPKPFWDLMNQMGMPEHVKSFKIECKDANGLVEIECTFYPTMPDGELIVKDDRFVTETKKYKLVEVQPEPREIPLLAKHKDECAIYDNGGSNQNVCSCGAV